MVQQADGDINKKLSAGNCDDQETVFELHELGKPFKYVMTESVPA